MENKAILGIITITAIISLVFMFSTSNTGAGVYVNYNPYTQQVIDPFPYAREKVGYAFAYEYPAATVTGESPALKYGGAHKYFITATPHGVKSTMTTYKKAPETDVPSAQTTGVAIKFPNGILATQCYSYQMYQVKAADPDRKCFTKDWYGRLIKDLLPQYYGCCTS